MNHKQIKQLLITINRYLPLIIVSIVIIVTVIATPAIIAELTKHTHVYGEWERFRDPSCSEQGIDRRICDCGDIQELSIDKLEHTPGDWIVDVESNEKKLYCSVCNKVIKSESLGDHTTHTGNGLRK